MSFEPLYVSSLVDLDHIVPLLHGRDVTAEQIIDRIWRNQVNMVLWTLYVVRQTYRCRYSIDIPLA